MGFVLWSQKLHHTIVLWTEGCPGMLRYTSSVWSAFTMETDKTAYWTTPTAQWKWSITDFSTLCHKVGSVFMIHPCSFISQRDCIGCRVGGQWIHWTHCLVNRQNVEAGRRAVPLGFWSWCFFTETTFLAISMNCICIYSLSGWLFLCNIHFWVHYKIPLWDNKVCSIPRTNQLCWYKVACTNFVPTLYQF